MNKIFKEGLLEFGNKSFSTSIVKRLEKKCNDKLRAPNFPIKLIDNQKRKLGIEIKF